jgi:hypothetical protein
MESKNQQFLRRLALFLIGAAIVVGVGAMIGAFGWARWEVIAIVLLLMLYGAYRLVMPEITN